jgi:hypothetical protein
MFDRERLLGFALFGSRKLTSRLMMMMMVMVMMVVVMMVGSSPSHHPWLLMHAS